MKTAPKKSELIADALYLSARIRKLERENIALRADRDRLDCLEKMTKVDPGYVNPKCKRLHLRFFTRYFYNEPLPTLRAAIDTARKEAKQ